MQHLQLQGHRVYTACDGKAVLAVLIAEENVNQGSQKGGARRFLVQWFRRETVNRALKIAGVVGPILTLINQYDVLLRLEFSLLFWIKVLLTFSVPYCVSSFSSARAYMEQERREQGVSKESHIQ